MIEKNIGTNIREPPTNYGANTAQRLPTSGACKSLPQLRGTVPQRQRNAITLTAGRQIHLLCLTLGQRMTYGRRLDEFIDTGKRFSICGKLVCQENEIQIKKM